MRELRVAILGQGRSGRDIHAQSLARMEGRYKIVAVVDESSERRQRAEVEIGCPAYEHDEDLPGTEEIDLVVNALPSAQHVPVTAQLLDRGYHVLCEKPLARHAIEVDRLIELAAKRHRCLAVFQQSRFSPAFMQTQRVIESGVLGRIVQVFIAYNGFSRRWDWQTLKSMNGGNLLNTGPHPVDQALQLFGADRMPNVFCRMDRANSFGDAEDYVKLVLFGDGRPNVEVEISSCSAYPVPTYTVQGTRGGLVGNMTHLDWRYFDADAAEQHQVELLPLQNADGTPAYCREQLIWHDHAWDLPSGEDADLFFTMTRSFYFMLYEHLVEGKPLKVSPEQVKLQVAVMEECFRQNPEFAS